MKKRIPLFLALLFVLLLASCGNRTMNDIIAGEPSITGTVKTVTDDSILMENGDGEYWVSLNVECGDSVTHFRVGDEVVVYFDGQIGETYPMQIHTVYAITLKTPADREGEALADLRPMVMVDGVLYLDTGEESATAARCGMMDGRSLRPWKAGKSP